MSIQRTRRADFSSVNACQYAFVEIQHPNGSNMPQGPDTRFLAQVYCAATDLLVKARAFRSCSAKPADVILARQRAEIWAKLQVRIRQEGTGI